MSDISDVRSSDEPHDRLTRLCAAMTDTLNAHPDRGDERCIVFLQDGVRGGMQLHGYTNPEEAIADLLGHLRAMLEASGIKMSVVPLAGPQRPADN